MPLSYHYQTITRIDGKGPVIVGKRRKIGLDTFSQFSLILLTREYVRNDVSLKIYINDLRISSMSFINLVRAIVTFMSNVNRKSVYLRPKTLKI